MLYFFPLEIFSLSLDTPPPPEPGTILEFSKDKTITCEVHDETKIKFREKITSLTSATQEILVEMGYDWQAIQGPRFWTYKGKTLTDLRDERE